MMTGKYLRTASILSIFISGVVSTANGMKKKIVVSAD
jgi:hypothetical protein